MTDLAGLELQVELKSKGRLQISFPGVATHNLVSNSPGSGYKCVLSKHFLLHSLCSIGVHESIHLFTHNWTKLSYLVECYFV